MAIPLSANQDSIEEQYQRLERILYELYLVLRALMEPQATPISPAAHQQQPRGGSGGAGSRRNRRRNNSSSTSSGRRCCSNGSSCQNGPQNPPPPPPPGCGDSTATTASTTSVTKLMLLNLANAAGKKTAVPGCAVVDSVQWGQLGYDLRSVADSINSSKCQELAPNSPLKSSSSTSSSSTLKLVTMALSLMMSRDCSLN